MNSTAFEESLRGFKTDAAYTSSPFAPQKGEQQNKSGGMLSGLAGIFSSGGRGDSLPFSYADAAHTRTAPAAGRSETRTWPSWPTWLSGTGDASTPSMTTAQLTKTQQWMETMGLSRTQRYMAFGICIAASLLLFLLAMFHLPLVVLRPARFVVPYCMASLFILVSFGFLHGFVSYSRHLFSRSKLPYSLWFMLSTLATLYSALSLHSYVLTVLMALVQMAAMMVFVVSYVPGGSSGITIMSNMIGSSIKSRFTPTSF